MRRRIPYILLAAALLSVPIFLARDEMETDRLRKDRFWNIKIRENRTFDIVFGGDSRVFRGISPPHFTEEFPGRKAYNYAFWANGYGTSYMEGLEGMIDTSSDLQMLVLGIPPHSLTRKSARSIHYNIELRKKKQSSFETIYMLQIRQYFAPYTLENLKRKMTGKFRAPNYRIIYHSDNGYAESWWVKQDTTRAARSYKDIFRDDPVDEEVIAGLLDKVRYWTAKGILVVGYRPPASHTIRQYEREKGGYKEADFIERFRAAGAIWIDVPPDDYQTFDGSHLDHLSAFQLSGDLARQIKAQLGEDTK